MSDSKKKKAAAKKATIKQTKIAKGAYEVTTNENTDTNGSAPTDVSNPMQLSCKAASSSRFSACEPIHKLATGLTSGKMLSVLMLTSSNSSAIGLGRDGPLRADLHRAADVASAVARHPV